MLGQSKQFFFLTFQHKGEDINKKLRFNSDTVFMSEREIFMVDGKSVTHAESTAVKLSYYANKNSTVIEQFNLVTPDNVRLVSEVKLILNESGNKSYSDKLSDVLSYLNEFYGKPDEDNVKKWLKENFGLSK
jgi:hypothetical protein